MNGTRKVPFMHMYRQERKRADQKDTTRNTCIYFVERWFITNIFQFLKYIFWLTWCACEENDVSNWVTWGCGNKLVKGRMYFGEKCHFFHSGTRYLYVRLLFFPLKTHTDKKIAWKNLPIILLNESTIEFRGQIWCVQACCKRVLLQTLGLSFSHNWPTKVFEQYFPVREGS